MQTDIKAEAMRLVQQLPVNSTWNDLMYEIYVRSAIESGIADCDNGNVMSVAEVRKSYGLEP